jgi:hypothetical protein
MKKNLWVKVAAVMISSLLSVNILAAGPDQLDVLGLIPGVSELSQVRQVGKLMPSSGNDDFIGEFEIGGHKIQFCVVKFIYSKLANFGFILVKNSTSSPIDTIYSDMKKEFTKKFGKPNFIPLYALSDNKYIGEKAIWKDKRGNQLLIALITLNGEVTGFLSLQSSEYLKQAAEKEAKKKF